MYFICCYHTLVRITYPHLFSNFCRDKALIISPLFSFPPLSPFLTLISPYFRPICPPSTTFHMAENQNVFNTAEFMGQSIIMVQKSSSRFCLSLLSSFLPLDLPPRTPSFRPICPPSHVSPFLNFFFLFLYFSPPLQVCMVATKLHILGITQSQ